MPQIAAALTAALTATLAAAEAVAAIVLLTIAVLEGLDMIIKILRRMGN